MKTTINIDTLSTQQTLSLLNHSDHRFNAIEKATRLFTGQFVALASECTPEIAERFVDLHDAWIAAMERIAAISNTEQARIVGFPVAASH